TREEARARAFEALTRIKSGQPFDLVVGTYTDEPGGAARKGELGRFTRDKMVKPFSDAAFALDVGQVSTVIESPFGFHVIRRIEYTSVPSAMTDHDRQRPRVAHSTTGEAGWTYAT